MIKKYIEKFGEEWTYEVIQNGKEIACGYGWDLSEIEEKQVIDYKVINEGDIESQIIVLYVK